MTIERPAAGAWIPGIVFITLYGVALFGSQWVSRRFWTSAVSPGNDPPWYFIGQDLIYGLLCFAVLIVTLTVALRTRRRYGSESWMAAWMATLWLGYPTVQALYVLARTSRIWDAEAATSGWRTFDEYQSDPLRYVLFAIALICAFIFAMTTRRLFTAAR